MKCKTRDFGELELGENDIIIFGQPPFGFEDYTQYTLIQDPDVGAHIAWLQSVQETAVCFILFDPTELGSFYKPQLTAQQDALLGEGELECWVIGVVPEDFRKTTVNLKSPVIINNYTRRGAQIILEQDYPVRYPLMQKEG